jgi:DMSO/TMAO reductase YedYZ molybdopterin-dependent catalytic subunit
VQKVLTAMSKWNDGVQGWLFDPKRLAPEFPASRITEPFPFNAYYEENEVRLVDANDYRLEVGGQVKERNLAAVRALRPAAGFADHAPHLRRGLERDRQVERPALSRTSSPASAPTRARAMSASSARTTTTPASTWPRRCNPQTIMAFRFGDQGAAAEIRLPWKLRIPTKLGFKNPST